MKYNNTLSISSLLGVVGIYMGIIFSVISYDVVFRAFSNELNLTNGFIGISYSFASLLILISSIGMIMTKNWGRIILSVALHLFCLTCVATIFIYISRLNMELFLIFILLSIPIVMMILFLHNDNIISEVRKK